MKTALLLMLALLPLSATVAVAAQPQNRIEGVYAVRVVCPDPRGSEAPAPLPGFCGDHSIDRLVVLDSLGPDGLRAWLVHHETGAVFYAFNQLRALRATNPTFEATSTASGTTTRLRVRLDGEQLSGTLLSSAFPVELRIEGSASDSLDLMLENAKTAPRHPSLSRQSLASLYRGTYDNLPVTLVLQRFNGKSLAATLSLDGLPGSRVFFNASRYDAKTGVLTLVGEQANGDTLKLVLFVERWRDGSFTAVGQCVASLSGDVFNVVLTAAPPKREPAFAAKKPKNNMSAAKKTAAVAEQPATPIVVVTPENLQSLLAAGHNDVVQEMSAVLTARDSAELARDELLPSINLNLGLTVVSAPGFLASSVSCLVPFLFPSNWYDYYAAKNTFLAEAKSAQTITLNAYATAYSLLTRVAADQAILEILRAQLGRAQTYATEIEMQFRAGFIAKLDVSRTHAELAKSKLEFDKAELGLRTELAAVRKMLTLPASTQLVIALPEPLPSSLEELETPSAIQAALAKIEETAPELEQMQLLEKAAQNNVKSVEWSFLDGCSGSQGTVGNHSTSAFQPSGSFDLDLGVGLFPSIRVAKRALSDLAWRKGQIQAEMSRVLETSLAGIETSKALKETSAQYQASAEHLVSTQAHALEVGHATLKDLLDSFGAMTAAQIEHINAGVGLASFRTALNRLALENEFATLATSSQQQIDNVIKKH